MELTAGIKGSQEMTARAEHSANNVGDGMLDVFSTPSMIALMEKTAWASIEPYLDNGVGTVGTQMNVKHQAATPIGKKIRCESELIQADGRRLVFTVKAYDEAGQIGEGEHERFIVQKEKFQEKALHR